MRTNETPQAVTPAFRRLHATRVRSFMTAAGAGLLLVLSLSGCACRPGFIGPYGGYHPTRCFVG